MKRILALIMVLAMVFAFAACKSKDDGATTTDPSSAGGEVIDNGEGSTPVDASAADSTEGDILPSRPYREDNLVLVVPQAHSLPSDTAIFFEEQKEPPYASHRSFYRVRC